MHLLKKYISYFFDYYIQKMKLNALLNSLLTQMHFLLFSILKGLILYFSVFTFMNEPFIMAGLLFYSPRRLTFISRKVSINTSKRFMLSASCMFSLRAAYHLAVLISVNAENLKKNNSHPLICAFVKNALNDQEGIPQHKDSLLRHLSTQKFPIHELYNSFYNETDTQNLITYEPGVLVDFRTMKELAILKSYLKNFGADIETVSATADTVSTNFFKAKQTNVDFWVLLKKISGLEHKQIYQDEKAGKDMFRHTTGGSLGEIYFDGYENNIQMTTQPITIEYIREYNERKIRNIYQALKHDRHWEKDKENFERSFLKLNAIVEKMKGKSFKETVELHKHFQDVLWKNFQCNPNFARSISFVFLKQIIFEPSTETEHIFSKIFQSHLKQNYLYDLNRKGDLMEVYNAWIYAATKIDPLFVEKLQYMHVNGLTLTHDILTILKEITKHAIS